MQPGELRHAQHVCAGPPARSEGGAVYGAMDRGWAKLLGQTTHVADSQEISTTEDEEAFFGETSRLALRSFPEKMKCRNNVSSAGTLFHGKTDEECAVEKYHIMHGNGGWAIAQNEGGPEGSYATREGALEAVYLAASNDIKRGVGISIVIDPPEAGEAAMGGSA